MKLLFVTSLFSLLGALVGRAAAAELPSFKDATRAPDQAPAKKSINGKSIAEMKAQVEATWDQIVFEKDGQPIVHYVTLDTDAGKIEIEFMPEVAPSHVRSFVALSKAGFFDGLIFHRCIPGFMIQGGCPAGEGTGGPGYCLKPEFSRTPHVRGVLSMARALAEDSAGSQFFVCVAPTPSLDRKYTVFGQVTAGLDVVDKIVGAATDPNDRPVKPVTIRSATAAIR